jgi:hypothetical protein
MEVIDKKRDFLAKELNNVEIYGLIALFREFYGDYLGTDDEPTKHDFFYSDGHLQSADDANGKPIFFEGYIVDELTKKAGSSDLTYMVLRHPKTKTEYLCEFNAFNGQWYRFDKTWSKTVQSGKTF